MPGDKWLYVKIYTGNKTADKILLEVIHPFIKKLLKEGKIEKWFFIRYADPDFHLRVRFYLSDKANTGEIVTHLQKRLQSRLEKGMVWKVQYDTYNRELERYGNELIEDSETVFCMDSNCILSLINILDRLDDENYRWMIALRLMDDILTAFSFDTKQKMDFFTKRSDAFKTEFGFNEHNAKQFNTKFRQHKKTIEAVLHQNFNNPEFLSLYLPLRKSMKELQPVAATLISKTATGKHITIEQLLASYIHMTLNRLFRSKNRKHELVLYDFMRRYYISEVARKKYNVQ